MGRKAKNNRSPGSRDPSRQERTIYPAARERMAAEEMRRRERNLLNRRARARNFFKVLAVCCFLLLMVLLVFGQTTRHEFICCDDNVYIFCNPYVMAAPTWDSVQATFTAAHAGNWHPLTWLSHMLDVRCYGIHPGPEVWKGPEAGGHHLTSVLLHAAGAIVLFLALRQMTGTFWRSALVAAIFAVHPLHVESVAWACERKDVLSGLFWMLTMLAYGWYARRPGVGRYVAVVVAFGLGLMAKSMLVTLPCVLLLLDFWPLGRWRPSRISRAPATQTPSRFPSRSIAWLVAEKVPLFGLAALVSWKVAVVQADAGAMSMMEWVPYGTRLANAAYSYIAYLSKTIWPNNLAIFYPYSATIGTGSTLWMVWQGTISAIVLAAITLLVLWKVRRWPYLSVGWFWYLGTLVPVIGLIRIGAHAMADRYTYLPAIGIYVMLVWGAADLAALWHWAGRRVAIAGTAGLLLATLTTLAAHQTAYWKDSFTVFQHAVDVTSDNYFAHNHLGVAYANAGNMEAAGAEYAEAVRTGPSYDAANGNLGGYYMFRGQVDKATACFQNAVRINPVIGLHHGNLGNAYLSQGRLDEAEVELRLATRKDPNTAAYHKSFAEVLFRQGKISAAMAERRMAVGLSPDDVIYLNETAWLLATHPDPSVRNGAEAVAYATRANQLTGDRVPLLLGTLAAAYAEVGQFAEALQIARRALELATQQKKKDQDQTLIRSIKARIPLYEAGTPVRDTPPSGRTSPQR
jgi:tetratricopeptide (TPR) repeat protein